jgi:hypothetical protein
MSKAIVYWSGFEEPYIYERGVKAEIDGGWIFIQDNGDRILAMFPGDKIARIEFEG